MRDDLFDLAVGDERPVHARYAPAPAMYSMSPWPSSCSAPCSPKIVRLSILEVT